MVNPHVISQWFINDLACSFCAGLGSLTWVGCWAKHHWVWQKRKSRVWDQLVVPRSLRSEQIFLSSSQGREALLCTIPETWRQGVNVGNYLFLLQTPGKDSRQRVGEKISFDIWPCPAARRCRIIRIIQIAFIAVEWCHCSVPVTLNSFTRDQSLENTFRVEKLAEVKVSELQVHQFDWGGQLSSNGDLGCCVLLWKNTFPVWKLAEVKVTEFCSGWITFEQNVAEFDICVDNILAVKIFNSSTDIQHEVQFCNIIDTSFPNFCIEIVLQVPLVTIFHQNPSWLILLNDIINFDQICVIKMFQFLPVICITLCLTFVFEKQFFWLPLGFHLHQMTQKQFQMLPCLEPYQCPLDTLLCAQQKNLKPCFWFGITILLCPPRRLYSLWPVTCFIRFCAKSVWRNWSLSEIWREK